jgi:glyoxylase-like metal-dependent hydrolase (beta-lactamase superfamily II)
MALDPARIYPAHGPVIIEPAALLRGYVEHRRLRERQVIDAVRRGDSHPAAIVARVYPELDKALVTRAEETVIAHLVKLEQDGVARRTFDAWHIIDP